MKTLRISDDAHEKLTALLGELTAQTARMQTYQDAIEALLKESVILPADLIAQIENFIGENRQLGYTTKEEFTRDAVRRRLDMLSEKYETIEIPKEEYDKLKEALRDLNTPYLNVTDFIYEQIKKLLEEHDEWKEEQKELKGESQEDS